MDAIMVEIFAYILEVSAAHSDLGQDDTLTDEQARAARRCGDLFRWLAEDELLVAIVESYIERYVDNVIRIEIGPEPAPDVLH